MRSPSNQQRPGAFELAALFGGSVAVFIGLLGLAGWFLGLPVLASFSESYIPVALGTCTVLLIQGTTLVLHVNRPMLARQWPVAGMLVLAVVFSALTFIGYLAGAELSFEKALWSSGGHFGRFPINRMSPVTGLLCSLTGISLLALIRQKSGRWVPHLAGAPAITAALAGLVGTVAYLYRAPLLYSGGIIPLALPTNVALMFLGLGLVAAAGPNSFFLRHFTGNSVRAMLLRTFVPLGFLAVICSDILEHQLTKLNSALISAASAVFFGVVAAVIAMQAARILGRIIDKAEAERRVAEEALRRAEKKYRGIFENAMEGIYQSSPEGQLIEVNPALARIFGYASPEELKNAITAIPDSIYKDPKRRLEFIDTVREHGSAVFEIQVLRKDGSTGWISDNMRVIHNGDGRITHFEGIAEDITEQKRAEQEREGLIDQLQDALANVKTLSGLLPICSHCKNIRNDEGYWQKLEAYFHEHSGTQFSHGICPDCRTKHYSEFLTGGKSDSLSE